ncbi:N-acetylglucosaminyldiphosphoundecaprenol N-acetyl-beta-D-mannosaminyltransferase [bioreactor metagenome]|uniref:N-acetylglucosaminyldiphosphoundecaprenol N-acetyl-beta-D-mannosaminyltransferase n=1 Tax=bioreactor metagenome TaxID=1076179 RepID=A0A645A5Y8_9ZZZZ|nr:WecB/TagA/CpsF family glycosyltransferase [Candidatus Metalachnospira sp.]
MGKTTILGVPFDTGNMKDAADSAVEMMGESGQHIICTPNPEIVMEAQNDAELMGILRAADMVTPDGVGILWASKYSEVKINERVSGYDLVINIFERIKNTDYTVYMLGGAPGVAEKAAEVISQKYEGLKIVGVHDGYFNAKDENNIISDIKKLQPSLLLVGLGSPKQEKWIYNNLRLTGAKLAIGIGGSFDVMSGNIKRAPKIVCKMGIEWLYRLVKQPTRFTRMLRLPKFVLKVKKEMK